MYPVPHPQPGLYSDFGHAPNGQAPPVGAPRPASAGYGETIYERAVKQAVASGQLTPQQGEITLKQAGYTVPTAPAPTAPAPPQAPMTLPPPGEAPPGYQLQPINPVTGYAPPGYAPPGYTPAGQVAPATRTMPWWIWIAAAAALAGGVYWWQSRRRA